MKKLIVVADWAEDGLKAQEFRSAVEGFLRDLTIPPNISFVPIQKSTFDAAYTLSQIVETENRYGHPAETVMYVMADNRLHGDEKTELPNGEQFFLARLFTGIYVCGPNAGYTFSLIKPKIERLFTYTFKDEELRENRSRDEYPKLLAYLMDALEEDLEYDEVHTNLIPEIIDPIILDVDTFGNITMMLNKEALKGKYELYEDVKVTIGDKTHTAKYTDKMFGDHVGHLVIFPGTAGNPEEPYLEIAVWDGNAAELFGNPTIGTPVKLS
jgi:hypothetical protein